MKLFDITWAGLHNLWYTPLLVLVLFVLIYKFYWLYSAVKQLVNPRWRNKLLRGFSPTRLIMRTLLFTIAFLFLFLALLQPQWDKHEEKIVQETRDLFIALDVSRSMLATDNMPDRLSFAKEKIRSLVHALGSDRVGLILFSGSTFVQCPLTSDYGAFMMFLDGVDVETISSGTTAIDQAIRKALEVFKQMPGRKHKLLVLLTDGEDFSRNLTDIKQRATNEGMSIFALGVGTPEGAPIPLYDQQRKQIGHQHDEQGKVVISKLNEPLLAQLAADSGGAYVCTTHDDRDVQTIARKVAQIEKEKIEDKTVTCMQEQYSYFVGVSFIALLIEWLL